ncbi:MAG: TlpA disulfide reductase family protein [Wenzhouxiangellaceae bacterium]|nr:TlpA disulfide reductase family protein [Wenzhouxiangellaceae bacterium]
MSFAARFVLVAGLATALGVALGSGLAWLTRPDPGPAGARPAASAVGDRRPDFSHAGLDGRLWRASDFDGAPLVVNFWATWCKPCVREMPVLDAFHDAHAGRANVVGIAIDDPGRVREFVAGLEIDYPILIGSADVRETQRRFGNSAGMLPFTVLVNAEGRIRWQHLGEVDRAMLDQALAAMGAAEARD